MLAMPKIKNEEQFGNILMSSPSLSLLCSATENLYVAKELKTSLGVPDYVLLTENDYQSLEHFAKRYSHAHLSGKYAAVVYYVSKNERVDIVELALQLNRKRNEIINALTDLEEWGIIDFDVIDRSSVCVSPSFSIPVLNSVSIELKLSSWEKALWQAIRNSSQFTSSYVVMPSDKLDLLNSKVGLFASNSINTAVFDIESMALTHVHENKTAINPINSRYSIESLDCLVRNLAAFERVPV